MENNNAPKWDLTKIFANAAEFVQARQQLSASTEKLTEYEGKIESRLKTKQDAEEFMLLLDDISGRSNEIRAFTRLKYSEDTGNEKAKKAEAEAKAFVAECLARTVFIYPELAACDIGIVDLFPEQAKHWVAHMIEKKKHTLSPELEKYITDKTAAPDLGARLFDDIIGNLRFHGGKTLMQTLNALEVETSRSLRRKIYTSLSKGLDKHRDTFALMANCKIADHNVDIRWRKHEEPGGIMHLHNKIEPEDVAKLRRDIMSCCQDTTHPYFRWKSKKLGRPKGLRPWDVNAPISENDTRIFSWDEAKDLVLECFYEFSDKFGDLASEMFDRKLIDAVQAPKKRIGGFCQPVSASKPTYILMSWGGTPRDLEILAHETGHAIHTELGNGLGDTINLNMPLTLAETASVFSEMLLHDLRKKKAKDEAERQALIAEMAGSKIHTCFYTMAACEFEYRRHAEHAEKGELSADRMGELWIEVVSEYIGPVLIGEKILAPQWSRIVHFVRYAYYCYAYTFGDCMVNSLWSAFKQGVIGAEDVENLLATGHSKDWKQAVRETGLDPDHDMFWKNGVGTIREMVNSLK